MNITTTFKKTAVAIALLSSFSSQGISAEEASADEDKGLEVIMVTAQKRVQNVKEVPISMSAVNQEKLMENNISDTEELSAYIANFSVSESGQGFNVIMRGLGSGPNQGFEQTVGTFVDGIYRGRGHLMRSAFLDLERVEVLRGPQSALFGKNTTAGALNLTTAKPTEDLQGYINTSYDFSFDETTIEGAVSNSITDNLQARVALKVIDGGGYQENTVTGNDEVGHETYNARVTLAWQPSSDLNVTLSAQHDNDELTGYAPSQVYIEPAVAGSGAPILGIIKDWELDDKSHKTNPALGEVEAATFEADHVTLNLEYDMGDLVLTATSGYQDYELSQSNDADQSVLPMVYRALGNEAFTQISQEVRLTSANDGAFNYIAGVYYQETDLDYDEIYRVYPLVIDGDRQFNVDSKTQAVFAQFNYQLSEQWEATLGLRYSNEDKDGTRDFTSLYLPTGKPIVETDLVTLDPAIAARFGLPAQMPGINYSIGVLKGAQDIIDHNLAESRSESHFTPSLNIKYKLDNMMFYGSIATGAKAGGFDSRSNNDSREKFEFDDESVISYELGSKLTLDDGLADINFAIFNMEFEDLQTTIYDGSTGFFVENGGLATSRGIEMDGRWAFADNWLLSGSVGLLDFKWDEFTGAKCFKSATVTPDNVEEGGLSCDMKGKTNAFAPDFSGSLALEYYTELNDLFELKATVDLIHKSDYYTNADLNPWTQQEAYTKLNARVSLLDIGGTWQVALLAKNLTDETTASFSIDMPLMPAGFYNVWTEPGRSVSMQLSYNFE
ncbi:TonB-dependent receptor [Thalassotalea sp. PLHSN55]|uniref:TonB-dependent receptor n=1 Tax=Thalassotalea sp. PLHSN55 TaxID=3435888 RepID=UPI003F8767C1